MDRPKWLGLRSSAPKWYNLAVKAFITAILQAWFETMLSLPIKAPLEASFELTAIHTIMHHDA